MPDLDARNSRNVSIQRRRFVELNLDADATAVTRALDEEAARLAPSEPTWYGSTGRKYNHHPVTMPLPGRLTIEWGVTPPVESFLAAMRLHVAVEASEERTRDFVRLASLSRREQEERLLELAEAGLSIEAIKIARMLYSYDLAEARALVDNLLRRRAPQSRAS
jgi:ribosomal protein L7/L12